MLYFSILLALWPKSRLFVGTLEHEADLDWTSA
jgi:hypothetical protein